MAPPVSLHTRAPPRHRATSTTPLILPATSQDNLATAKEVLQDERVALLRYRLVPSQMDEAHFWRALFYRLSLPDDDSGVEEGAVVLRSPIVVERTPARKAPPPAAPHDAAAVDEGVLVETPTVSVPMPPLNDDYFTPQGTARGSYEGFESLKAPPSHE